LIALLLALPAALQALQVPTHDGWVTDNAGLLTPSQEAELEDLLDRYRLGTGHDLAVLTVKSLGGRPIEELGLETARAWELGTKEKSDGALLVIASEDRIMRFEVLQGLEGDLPDVICGRIIRDVITPAFKEGRYYDGIRGGLIAAQQAIGGEYGSPEGVQHPEGLASALCPVLLLLLFAALAAAGRRGGRSGGASMGGGGLFEALLLGSLLQSSGRSRGWHGGGGFSGGGFSGGGGGFRGFGGGGRAGGGGATGRW
jgi:uncharacterized protein